MKSKSVILFLLPVTIAAAMVSTILFAGKSYAWYVDFGESTQIISLYFTPEQDDVTEPEKYE